MSHQTSDAFERKRGEVMVTGGLILLILIIGAGGYLSLALRARVADVAQRTKRLSDPATPTVEYAIPNGVDPAEITAPLAMAGFEAIVEENRAHEALLIACEAGQRERLRSVIHDIHLRNYDGSDYEEGRVVFEDERGNAGPWKATA